MILERILCWCVPHPDWSHSAPKMVDAEVVGGMGSLPRWKVGGQAGLPMIMTSDLAAEMPRPMVPSEALTRRSAACRRVGRREIR